jgi:hypothetical protein
MKPPDLLAEGFSWSTNSQGVELRAGRLTNPGEVMSEHDQVSVRGVFRGCRL